MKDAECQMTPPLPLAPDAQIELVEAVRAKRRRNTPRR